MKAPAPRAVTLRQFARILDVRPSYVTALKDAGRLVLDDDGRVLVDATQQLLRDTADPAKDGVRARHAAARAAAQGAGEAPAGEGEDDAAPAPGEPPSSDARRKAKALADAAEADARKKLRDEAVELGTLLHVDDVTAAVREAAATLRAALENLPTRLAPLLAAEADEGKCRVLLAEAVEHQLEDLARQFAAIGRAEAAT